MMVKVAGGGGAGPTTLTITVDHTKCGTADTTDYPLRLDITHASLKSVANGGAIADAQGDDIVITSDFAGTTPMSYDPLILWNPSTGRVVTNVKIGTLTHSTDVVFYVQAGAAGVTTFQGGSTGAAWDANFKAVYSLGDGSTFNLNDLTSNGDTLTNHATGSLATPTAGPNCGAADFTGNGSSAHQYMRNTNVLNIAQPTLEAWVNITFPVGNRCQVISFVDTVGGPTADHTLAIQDNTHHARSYLFDGGVKTTDGNSVTSGVWAYVAMTGDGTTQILYRDGASDATVACGNAFTGYTNNNLFLSGTNSGGGLPSFDVPCLIAEVRISNVARAASYFTATYNNISSASTFYTVT